MLHVPRLDTGGCNMDYTGKCLLDTMHFLSKSARSAYYIASLQSSDSGWELGIFLFLSVFLDDIADRRHEVHVACYCDPLCQCGVYRPLHRCRGITYPSTTDEIPTIEGR